MLSLLSRTASSAISAARKTSITVAASYRTAVTAAAPTVTGYDKLARRDGRTLDWRALDNAVANKSQQLRNEKQQSGPTSVAESWTAMSDKAVASLGPPLGKYAGVFTRAFMLLPCLKLGYRSERRGTKARLG